ncbi:MAG: sigma 54-interacting transcriptional regulator, partial [Pseudomonadota bacterium]|nr:sigma 54-interacting transcriptional regulator [Pseudomonadota bacterium]
MDLALQAKLLRVLQEKEVERIGGRKVLSLDVRVLATTNRTLRDEVKAGRFREDLIYRLNVFPLEISTLRERRDDILALSQRLLGKHASQNGRVAPVLDQSARDKLLSHSWPGNVRELDNVLQRALILQSGETLKADDVIFEALSGAEQSPVSVEAPVGVTEHLDSQDLRSQEQRHILDVLEKNQGSRRLTARELGISERTLRYKIARFRDQGVDVPDKTGKKSA